MLHIISIFVLCICAVACQNATIEVSGSGSAFVKNESVNIRLSVVKRASTAIDAQTLTSNAINSIVTFLQQQNVTNLQTDGISLQPYYNYTSSDQVLLGFESNNAVSCTVAPETAGTVLDGAVRQGANSIDSLQLIPNIQNMESTYNVALDAAMNDAKTKAQVVASAVNMCVKGAATVTIRQDSFLDKNSFVMMEATTSTVSDSTPTVLPGRKQITANVDVSFVMDEC